MLAPVVDTKDLLDTSNTVFKKAVSFVMDTDQNLFLTGKAGTGKTTFLKYIREHTQKPMAVIAPTGVAAINAGGETIHSFLQLPFGPFVPGNLGASGIGGDINDRHTLIKNLKLRDTKLKLLRKLKLLIIDEVSMVRCDVIDAIDMVLRHARRNWSQPFGGVQMVFIGDLFQLPPVALPEEWDILGRFYASPYFFDAQALRANPLVYIELQKIYRQKEQTFIGILNRIRKGTASPEDIEILNERYDDKQQKKDGYIVLATHNHIADAVNRQELEQLPGKLHTFEGTVIKEFNPRNMPTEQALQLKVGAQIMFIKNDMQTPRRYYNGKIGKVFSINPEGIWIEFEGESDHLKLAEETWRNVQYTLNPVTSQVEEKETGSFIQFPIRLAWAVTIHKSQGLTLQKAIVDLNRSFTSGQVYVALSRCTTLEGIVLRSKLHADNIMVDDRVVQFALHESDEEELEVILDQGMRQARATALGSKFSFSELIDQVEEMQPDLAKRKTGPKEENMALCEQLLSSLVRAEAHAEAFKKQIQSLALNGEEEKLNERCSAAIKYFTEQVLAPAIQSIDAHILVLEHYTKVLKQVKMWRDFSALIKKQSTALKSAAGVTG
jgi:hypothetical protein